MDQSDEPIATVGSTDKLFEDRAPLHINGTAGAILRPIVTDYTDSLTVAAFAGAMVGWEVCTPSRPRVPW